MLQAANNVYTRCAELKRLDQAFRSNSRKSASAPATMLGSLAGLCLVGPIAAETQHRVCRADGEGLQLKTHKTSRKQQKQATDTSCLCYCRSVSPFKEPPVTSGKPVSQCILS